MVKKLNVSLICLLFLFILKEIIFGIVIPVFQTPDEQAHFAQVAYFAELNKMPDYKIVKDLNSEIYKAEQYLGTNRDDRGNNLYTYHPEYKIEYTKTTVGKFEKQIQEIPTSDRKVFIKQEAARYPPLYYWISAQTYKLFYGFSLIDRIYASRAISILLGTGTVLVAWLIGKQFFRNNNLLSLSLASMVAFHPMFSFVSAGVSSDNLMNFLFSLLIYLGLLIINYGISLKLISYTSLVMGMLFFTKPQFILGIPILILAVLLRVFLSSYNLRSKIITGCLVVLAIFGVIIILSNKELLFAIQALYPQNFFPGDLTIKADFLSYLQLSMHKTIAETIPWYWGVFDWLGVTLPRLTNQIINRLMVVAVIGIVIKLFLNIKRKEKGNTNLIYLILVSVGYYLGVIYFDYLFYSAHHYSFGIQGRYFFPTIIAHMAVLQIGLLTFIPRKFQDLTAKVLVLFMIVLNFTSLWVLLKTHYSFQNIGDFILQMSQYKPMILKGDMVIFWFIIYLILLICFIFIFLKEKRYR